MRFVACTDWHLSLRGPVSRTDNWADAIFAKLDQVSSVAVKVKARAVLMPGDFFTQKTRIPYVILARLVRWCFDLRRQGIVVVGIPGNHDEVDDRYESIPTQPLGLLFECGAVINCSFQVAKFTEGEFTVGVIGNPYPHATDRATYDQLPAHGCDRSILLAHCFATPEGGSFFGTPVHRYDDLATLGYDCYVFGHDHSDHGVYQVGATQHFVNIGALSRGALVREEVRRDVKMAIIDVTPEGVKVQQLKLKVAPADEVFDLVLKAQRDREQSEIEEFVGRLSADLEDAGPVSFTERASKLDLPENVRVRVLTYIAEAESSAG